MGLVMLELIKAWVFCLIFVWSVVFILEMSDDDPNRRFR